MKLNEYSKYIQGKGDFNEEKCMFSTKSRKKDLLPIQRSETYMKKIKEDNNRSSQEKNEKLNQQKRIFKIISQFNKI